MSTMDWILVGLLVWFLLSIPFALFVGAFIRAGRGE